MCVQPIYASPARTSAGVEDLRARRLKFEADQRQARIDKARAEKLATSAMIATVREKAEAERKEAMEANLRRLHEISQVNASIRQVIASHKQKSTQEFRQRMASELAEVPLEVLSCAFGALLVSGDTLPCRHTPPWMKW